MARRSLLPAVVAAFVAFTTACNESPPSAPPADGPSFKTTPTFGCTFSGNPSVSNAVNAYFTVNSDRQAASPIISAMEAGFTASGFAGARDKGYDLLSLIGKVSRDSTGSSPEAGAVAIQQTVQCMFDVIAGMADVAPGIPGDFNGWPTDNQFDFATALTPWVGGASYVRGGTADSLTYPAIAKGANGNISGIAPEGTNTWPATVDGTADNRVLIYGEPVTGGYDWKLIPRTTTFMPSAVVALCEGALPAGQEFYNDDVMVRQESVGVLGFVGAQAQTICGLPPSAAFHGRLEGSFALLGRVARWFAPEPVYAAALLTTTTVGGRASGAKSDEFTSLPVPAVNLKFTSPGTQPPTPIKVNTRFSLKVNVSTKPGGLPAGGITVTLRSTTNNGTDTGIFEVLAGAPANIICDPAQVYIKDTAPSATTLGTVGVGGVSQPTNAVWDNNLCFSKTGSVKVIASSTADGRIGGIGTAISNKSTVSPN